MKESLAVPSVRHTVSLVLGMTKGSNSSLENPIEQNGSSLPSRMEAYLESSSHPLMHLLHAPILEAAPRILG